MEATDHRAAAVAPWRDWYAAFLRRGALSPYGAWRSVEVAWVPGLHTRLPSLLDQLASGGAAPIPAWVHASDQASDASGRLRDRRPVSVLREMWADREALLSLGVWSLLQCCAMVCGDADQLITWLMVCLSGAMDELPLALSPSLQRGGDAGGYAHSVAAQAFFNGRLRPALIRLGALRDGQGACFARWVLPDYDCRRPDLTSWSRAWSLAVAAIYLEWLRHSATGHAGAVGECLWHPMRRRFRPPQALLKPLRPGQAHAAVLPTDDDRLRFVLSTGIVLAQVLDHDPARWHALAAGVTRFDLELSMKGLDQADSRRWDAARHEFRNITLYRGLTVDQLYMAVTIELLDGLVGRLPTAQAATATASPPA